VDSEGIAHDAYGIGGPACVLVRPDGYIAFRGPISEKAALGAYLEKWFPGAKDARAIDAVVKLQSIS